MNYPAKYLIFSGITFGETFANFRRIVSRNLYLKIFSIFCSISGFLPLFDFKFISKICLSRSSMYFFRLPSYMQCLAYTQKAQYKTSILLLFDISLSTHPLNALSSVSESTPSLRQPLNPLETPPGER